MSAERQGVGVLDAVSRGILRRFGLRLLLLGAVAVVPAMRGATLETCMGSLAIALSLGCMINLGQALGRGERVADGPLNGWDEALAFAALSRLAHMAG